MDCVTLLREARLQGFTLTAEGGKLRIDGPRKLEAWVRIFAERKPEILAALEAEAEELAEREAIQAEAREAEERLRLEDERNEAADEFEFTEEPPGPPCACGSLMWWWDGLDRKHCAACDPPKQSERLRGIAERLRKLAAKRAKPLAGPSETMNDTVAP